MMRTTSPAAAIGLALLLAACATPATQGVSPQIPDLQASIDGAVADEGRPASDVEKDAVRHPAELIAFAGVKPGDVVMDVWPGGGYWTRLFSRTVGPQGKVIAYVPAEIAAFKSDPVGVAKKTAAEPGLGNVEAVSAPLGAPTPRAAFDVAWTFQNYHDLHNSFMGGADVAAFNRAIFAALKPGGVFVVVDHAAVAGSGLSATENLHRIDPATVKSEVEAAGFVLEATNPLLAHPEDPRTVGIFDPAIRGQTDQFIYKFRKPG